MPTRLIMRAVRRPTADDLKEAKRLIELWNCAGRVKLEAFAAVLVTVLKSRERESLLEQFRTKVTDLAAKCVGEIPTEELEELSADKTPVVLEKPRPEYTAEGRSMKIEGRVLIDLVFLADGSIQINRIVSGLGHGLDESAVRAARQIKFKPAKCVGEPKDFAARVTMEFRLDQQ